MSILFNRNLSKKDYIHFAEKEFRIEKKTLSLQKVVLFAEKMWKNLMECMR